MAPQRQVSVANDIFNNMFLILSKESGSLFSVAEQ